MVTVADDETLARGLEMLGAEYKIRAENVEAPDHRAAGFYLAIEELRAKWRAGLWAIEPLLGDRR